MRIQQISRMLVDFKMKYPSPAAENDYVSVKRLEDPCAINNLKMLHS